LDNQIIQNLREDYRAKTLEISDIVGSPFEQFKTWFQEALDSQLPEPNAFNIASVSADGKPSSRIVLLKEIEADGFVFYSNYNSRKGQDFAANPNVAMNFVWLELQRQVRIEGTIQKVPFAQSEAYFHKRPKGSQIGAWASPQSDIIIDRSVLEQRVVDLQAQYKDVDQLPCPEHWGGYIIKPTRIEFWQGRTSRLHDRLCFELVDGAWEVKRLAP